MSSRRDFIKKSAALALGAIAADTLLNKALAATETIGKENVSPVSSQYKLLPLPYAYDALEPHIDKQTMEIHYSKHHQSYVNNLNKALETLDSKVSDDQLTMETILSRIDKMPVAVRNNAGGHYNHALFWTLMKPNGGGEPKGKLAEAIKTSFGSFDEFKKQFADAAMKRFGSGWAWLVVNNGKLSIGSTANQDNPLMNLESVEIKGTPILALDVWEHAYYLKNQNRRADYITSWWNVVNWETAEELFKAAK
ncbi:MAG: superoxide dismutase [Bacteroidota bacterium]